ncbi:hypothetical protein A5893_14060 [Pedobacter psychrophilus]|uniref:Endonuclease GajA/Old nuclease/RecF-like AAA domain-containing protein n=1 Tax=Pedobacter psychrophilus TaxID=1826909 RepID=A0A179DCN8_9SPHI|nr:AAA family ATPase [Pedobacter psychrophilus]OAQ38542.1 hypothetical protein A5893_14060 [Pedobacter psychrophilus]
MRLSSVEINNFKSIREIIIPFDAYGQGINRSNTNFLVGLNESGKSAIIHAISLIDSGLEDLDYDVYCSLEAQDEDEYIDIYGHFKLDEQQSWKKLITKKFSLDTDTWEKIEIISFTKNVYKNKDRGYQFSYSIKINAQELSLYNYVITKSNPATADGTTKVTETIGVLSKVNDIKEIITRDNASSFLKTNQRLLLPSELESWILLQVKENFISQLPKIQSWKASSDFLINEQINLSEFKENPSISIPLKNIFNVFGKKTDSDIKATIENALKNQARRDELEERLSDSTTKFINKIWKEHKIKIRISINSETCQVLVEDKDKKFNYYNMTQRSDGFKQFISLILSISAQNDSNNLQNTILLIDEPEIHLHPSGIKYMRDEILKIGKNNTVLVSTHSQFMIDTLSPERNFIVTKNKSNTEINQVSKTANIIDDNVLTAAFGLNIFKELIPNNIIVVEGGDDKTIISHAFHQLYTGFFFAIKSAGGASKMPGFARLLQNENISSFFIFDADKEGRDNKGNILDSQKDFYSSKNVFTLKDILNSLPNDSTIEDLYPSQFVKSYFEAEMNQTFIIDENNAVIIQLKQQCEALKNKQKLESFKIKLSNKFCEDFNSSKSIQKLERLNNLMKSLKNKIEEYKIL